MKLRTLTFSLLFSLAMSIHAANEKTTIEQVTDAVELTTDVDYIVTGDTPFATTGSVNIVNTEHAVLIISKIKPSKVLSNWMANIYINGEQAVASVRAINKAGIPCLTANTNVSEQGEQFIKCYVDHPM